MDSEILDQLTNLGRNVNSELTKPKRGRKKKADTKINELEDNDVRDKIERLVACILSGNSKMYLGKEYTEEQINEMDYNSIECDPFLNTAMQRFTCDLYYRFGALLAPISVGIITGKHYAKNSITKVNDRSNSGTCDPATRNCNQTEEPSEN